MHDKIVRLFFATFRSTPLRLGFFGSSFWPIALAWVAACLGAGTSAFAGETVKFTWPGDLDGPKSLWVTPTTLYMFSTFGATTALVGSADADSPPTDEKPFDQDDHATHGNILQVGHFNATTTRSSQGGHVVVDAVATSADSYSNAGDGTKVGSQQSTAIAHFDISPCPEVDGVAGGHISIQLRQETTYADGSKSSATALAEGPFRIVNGDDAHRVKTELDLQISGGSLHVGPAASDTDPVAWGLAGPLNLSWGTSGPTTVEAGSAPSWTWAGEFPIDGLAKSPAQDLAQLTVIELEKEVEKFWRSGKCIELKPDPQSRTVSPGEKVTLRVEAEQHFDHKEVKTPIVADLTGVKSISPKHEPVEEPAKFDFVAGYKNDDHGKIELTQTGKRGIGRATVDYSVKGGDLLFSCDTKIENRPASFTTTLPPTRLVQQEDGTYRGTGDMKVHWSHQNSVEYDIADGVNEMTIQARRDEKDPGLFHLKTVLKVTPIVGTTTFFKHRLPFSTELDSAEPWTDLFDLQLNKPTIQTLPVISIKRELIERPVKP